MWPVWDTTLTEVGEERDQDRSPDLSVPETGTTHDLAAAHVDAAGIISAVVSGFAQIPAKVHITIRIIGDAHEG